VGKQREGLKYLSVEEVDEAIAYFMQIDPIDS